MWEGGLYPEERAAIRNAVDRRRRHFTAGRRCAREALARLGIDHFPLLRGPDRRPRWPPGVVGTISHCDGACAAAVARAETFAGIGLDLETAQPLSPRLHAALLHPAESEAIAPFPAGERALAAKLIASAKECAYKALHTAPVRGGGSAPFRELRVTLELSGSARLHPTAPDGCDLPVGTWSATTADGATRLRGRFRCARGHIATAAVRQHPH